MINVYFGISEILITRASLSCFIIEYRCYKSRDKSIWQLARYVLWVNLVFKLIFSSFESKSPIQHMLTGCYNYSHIQSLGFYGFCGAFGDQLAMYWTHISQLLSKPCFQPRCLMNLWPGRVGSYPTLPSVTYSLLKVLHSIFFLSQVFTMWSLWMIAFMNGMLDCSSKYDMEVFSPSLRPWFLFSTYNYTSWLYMLIKIWLKHSINYVFLLMLYNVSELILTVH